MAPLGGAEIPKLCLAGSKPVADLTLGPTHCETTTDPHGHEGSYVIPTGFISSKHLETDTDQ